MRKILELVLVEKYGKNYNEDFIDNLLKKMAKEYQKGWDVISKLMADNQITVKQFLKIVKKSGSLDHTVD